MNHVTRMLEGLSEKELYRQTLACIDAALHWTNEDTALFVLHVTVGEFKKLTGFYASRKVVKYLIDAYVGRFTRFYCTAHPLAIQDVADVFLQVQELEWKAADRIVVKLTSKYGSVSKERIKELDDIADVWDMQDKNDLQDIIAGKPAPWEKESKTD